MKKTLKIFSSRQLLLILLCISLQISNIELSAQSILKIPLTKETITQWDDYIMKYAPSDSSLRVVQELANRHFITERAAVPTKYLNITNSSKSMMNILKGS